MAETVRCSNFSVRVLYAYTVRTNERLNVNIYCEVTNTSGRNWVFETPQYFKLNNNGILQSGHCDYDNAELANGASFYTTISFAYPENANANIGDMELTIEYDTVYLLNNPKTSDEFEGIYYADDGENYYVIAHISDNRYQMIYELFNEIEVEEFVLNEDNTFYPYSYDGAEAYIWLPQMHSIYHKDESLRIEFYLYKL